MSSAARRISCSLALVLCFSLLFFCPVSASADTGPKPSVHITFKNIGSRVCYGTLLSVRDRSGPSAAYFPEEDNSVLRSIPDAEGDRLIWDAFVHYCDSDGFFFLQRWWNCSEDSSIDWTYFPPDTFKILLYYPQQKSFDVSPVYTRYAFDSYYTVDLSAAGNGQITAERSYDYTWELISLAARIAVTILLELFMALLFRYYEKRQLLLFAFTNIVTQVLLNLALNIVNYRSGMLAFLVCYIFLECAVTLAELLLYVRLLPRVSRFPQRRRKAMLYACSANALSFAVGLVLAGWIPGIF